MIKRLFIIFIFLLLITSACKKTYPVYKEDPYRGYVTDSNRLQTIRDSSTLTNNPSTSTITSIWSDSAIAEGCLKIERIANGTLVISDQCTTSSTGSLSYTYVNTTVRYFATFYVRTIKSNLFNILTLEVNLLDDHLAFIRSSSSP